MFFFFIILFHPRCVKVWWFLGVYRVQGTTKEEFVANAIQVEMQRHHLYITHHASKVYQVKHEIINNDMV
jgi:hypothetical protein